MLCDLQTLKNNFFKDFARFYSPSSFKRFNYIVKAVEPFLPSDIRYMDSQHIYSWVISMKEKGLSPRTINTYLSDLNALVRYGYEKNCIQKLPDFRRLKIKAPERLLPFIGDEVLWHLVEASHCDPKHYAFMFLEYEVALRPSELSDLRRSDLDYPTRTLYVRNQNRVRCIILSIPCFLALREYLESRSDVDNHMFISSQGTALTPKSCSSIIKKYSRITGNESVIIRHFRVGLVSRLFEQGINIDRIANTLGYNHPKWSLLSGNFRNPKMLY